jgi:hypothetical protein
MMVVELESIDKRILLGYMNPMVCHDIYCDEL